MLCSWHHRVLQLQLLCILSAPRVSTPTPACRTGGIGRRRTPLAYCLPLRMPLRFASLPRRHIPITHPYARNISCTNRPAQHICDGIPPLLILGSSQVSESEPHFHVQLLHCSRFLPACPSTSLACRDFVHHPPPLITNARRWHSLPKRNGVELGEQRIKVLPHL